LRSFFEWLEQQILDNPHYANTVLGSIDVAEGAQFDGLTLTVDPPKYTNGPETIKIEGI